jgi:transcription elongation factor GreA
MAIQDRPVYLTREGLQRIEAELEDLRTVKRPEVAARIHEAKQYSNATDDGEYEDAKIEQAFVEGRILELEDIVRQATLIDEKAHSTDRVSLGSRVTVRYSDGECEDFTVVGSAEANPRQGRVSNESPFGRALLGRRKGETVNISAPGGVTTVVVDAIA